MTENRSIDHFDPEAKSYILELRGESARYRTERNELRDRFNEVNSKYTEAGQLLQSANARLDEFSAAKDAAEAASAELARMKEQVGRTSVWAEALGVDLSDAGRLQGASEEEWKADAEKLAPRFQKRPPGTPHNPAAGNPANEGGGKEDGIFKAFADAGLI